MRIALIGAGHTGSLHATSYAAMPGVEVVAVVGASLERAGPLAARLGARASTDLRTVLEDDTIQAVDVTVPTAHHAQVARSALEAGKHVFCETPLTATANEARQLRGRAREAGRHLQVALLLRFARPAIDLHEAVRRGRLGRPRAVSTRRLVPGTSGEHHGDVLEEIMLFDLDQLVWHLGVPAAVHATGIEGPSGRLDHAVVCLDGGATFRETARRRIRLRSAPRHSRRSAGSSSKWFAERPIRPCWTSIRRSPA